MLRRIPHFFTVLLVCAVLLVAPALYLSAWPINGAFPDPGGVGGVGTNPARTVTLSTSCVGVAGPCYTDLSDACAAAIVGLTGTDDAVLLVYPGIYTETPTANDSPAVNCSGVDLDSFLNVVGVGNAGFLVNGSSSIIVSGAETFTNNATVRSAFANWSNIEIQPGNDTNDIALQYRTTAGNTDFGINTLNNVTLANTAAGTAGTTLLDVQKSVAVGVSAVFVRDSSLTLYCAGACTSATSLVRINSPLTELLIINSFLETAENNAGDVNAETMLIDVQAATTVHIENSVVDPKEAEFIEADEDDVDYVTLVGVTFRALAGVLGQVIDVDDTTPDAVSPVTVYFYGMTQFPVPTAADDYGTNAIVTWGAGTFYGNYATDSPPTCDDGTRIFTRGMMYDDDSTDTICVCEGAGPGWVQLDADGGACS